MVLYFVATSIREKEDEKRKLRLLGAHEDALAEIKSSVNNFATLTAAIGSHIKYAEADPTPEELQQFLNHLLKDLSYEDSIIISVVDTQQIFKYSFTRTLFDPGNLNGTSVKQFRNAEEIRQLDRIMESEEMLLFEPFNLVEGWPGIAMNIGIRKKGVKFGYAAPIINLKHIVNNVYNDNAKEFAYRFTTSKGFDFDREAVYDGSPVYNTSKDPEYYQNFRIDSSEFIYTPLNVFDLAIRVGTAYKEDLARNDFFVIFMYAWYLILIAFSAVTFFQMYQSKKLNIELRMANMEIHRKNKDITDSINYARRIQNAILPTDDEFRKHLPQSFVLFRPKSIVSGDFYWMNPKPPVVYFAAVDCTGHGVPGALMSMIGNALLNEIVNEKGIHRPGLILDHLKNSIIEVLRQKGGSGSQDGMDIALCKLDRDKEILEYAGAYNALYLIIPKTGENATGQRLTDLQSAIGEVNLVIHEHDHHYFLEVKANKQPIGVHIRKSDRLFDNHIIPVKKGDQVYIFSDGFADQFGGPEYRKFNYKRFKNLLLANASQPMEQQQGRLTQAFDQWKDEKDQVDDICVIGVRI